jgi:hypothetical protein
MVDIAQVIVRGVNFVDHYWTTVVVTVESGITAATVEKRLG